MSDINTLREALFDTLAALKNKTIDLDRAKAINETAQTIINTAKVEVDFMKAGGKIDGTGFLPALTDNRPKSQTTAHGVKVVEIVPGGSITQHRIS